MNTISRNGLFKNLTHAIDKPEVQWKKNQTEEGNMINWYLESIPKIINTNYLIGLIKNTWAIIKHVCRKL